MRTLCTTAMCAAVAATALTPAAAQEPNFGRALALTESELFIGQPVNWYGPGTVYVYRADAAGQWVERSRLLASDSARMDDFGRALALDGNTLIVGAPRKRAGAGVAYAFQRASANADWREAAIIAPPAAGNHAEFASALALSGDELLIGSPATETTGVVYHYRRAGGAWRLHDVIRPTDVRGAAAFGRALSRQGDWLLIGAPAADSAAGRVFVSRRQSNGNWGQPQAVVLPAAMIGAGARVGSAVLLDGARAHVGAPGAAAVFVLARDGAGNWTPAATLQPAEAPRGTQFGAAIAAVGGALWVGAPGANAGNGRVYRFAPDGARGWRAGEPLDADSAAGRHWPFSFGYAIAAQGGRAVVSMPSRDFGEGRALSLRREGDAWRPRQLLEGEIFAIGRALEAGARCQSGRIGEFTCSNIQLVSHMPTSALGGERGAWVNDVWGWTDAQTGRDYALVARRDGASFVDVTDPSAPRLIGNLPRTRGSPPSVWRDIKVLNNHAYIVADGAGAHGMQVFDLTRLRAVSDTPAVFTPDTTYHTVFSAHNVVADTTSGFLYVVGANSGGETCGGGLHMVDARAPRAPKFAGCYNDGAGANPRGYTHDAQCVTYRGPDVRYRGREICVGSNEAEINIADVTDKSKPVTVGRNSYPNVAYAHQGWFDDEQRYFYMNDELDELAGHVAGTRTIVWDLSELDDPIVAREYIGPVRSSDHNLFVKGNFVYESNYGSGLRVLDISDRTNPREIGFFDSAPYNDDEPGHSATASGAWSNYPFFKSGIVIFTSVREGLFIVRVLVPVS
ncbi:MAG TPA: choice-of-anchor B family protein [Longimicrobiales bacterium]|nr:choice-of-anchor B family protein [Longimicrobiales bacterium]